MAWQVGNACYDNKTTAENVYFSAVVPVITQDGKLTQLKYDNNKKTWYLNNIKISSELPECSPLDNYLKGYELFGLLIPTAIVLFVGKLIIDRIK